MIYISGKITGNPNCKEEFKKAQEYWREQGRLALNPTNISLPEGADSWEEYMLVCLNLLKSAKAIYMLKNYKESKGAMIELEFARAIGLEVYYE